MRRTGAMLLLVLSLFAATACGDDKNSTSGTSTSIPASATTAIAVATTTAVDACTADKAGGTITFGEFLQPRTLDPANPSSARGVLGGSEMLALYDTLMRYDNATGKFEPRVAESLSANTDASEWTMKLRTGIKFGNGDPLNAQAVKASIERIRDPKLASAEAAFVANIAEMQTPDDRTVVFKLTGPWGGLPWFLADVGGMIVNVNVVSQLADKFGLGPKGAGVGPYEFVRFNPNEEIVLQAKKDYWAGTVCVDTLRYVALVGAGATYDALKNGTLNVAFLRDPVTIATARKDGTSSFGFLYSLGAVVEINHRAGRPGADPRVREALALAIDPKPINDRAWNGTGLVTSAIISEKSRWFQGLKGPDLNTDRAKQLVQQVIAEGKWDGTINFVAQNDPATSAAALAIETQLKAVGFQPKTDPVAAIAARRVAGDYDIVFTGISVADAAPVVGLTQLTSTGINRGQYKNADYDAAVARLKAASTDAAVKSALKDIQDIWTKTIPSIAIAASEEVIAWTSKVKGLVFGEESLVYFDKAYIAK